MRKILAVCGLGLLLAGCQVPGQNEATPPYGEEPMLPPTAEMEMPAPDAGLSPDISAPTEMPAPTEVPAAE